MILTKKNLSFNTVSLINFTFCFFPISFILGNLVTNINLLLFCTIAIFYLKSKILTYKFNFPLKIILVFFLLVIFSTSLNLFQSLYSGEYEKSDFSRMIKSILFFRFFIILLVIYVLSEFDIINYKFFFISAAIFPILISADVIFQYIFGFNVIGIKSLIRHNSSFFGDELISGGYIENFAFFSILFFIHKMGNKNNLSNVTLLIFTICILAIGILLSGNRMPFFLFLLGLFLLFFLGKKLRKILLISFCIIPIIFASIFSVDQNFKRHHAQFYVFFKDAVVSVSKKLTNDLFSQTKEKMELEKEEKWTESNEQPEEKANKKMIFTALETWKKNKVFGNGIKSFRVECVKILNEQKRGICSTHPHNYYIESLIDVGIVGIAVVIGIGFAFIIFLLRNYYALKQMNSLENLFLLAAIISLFLEVFPLKSSGSVFTTSNATYIILMASIIMSYKKLLLGKNFDR